MMTTSKMLGLLAVAFVAGSFVASPELRAYAANTVRSIDIVDGQVMTADLAANSVTAPKIKDGEVKAAEIAPNAVGSSEISTNAVGAAELQGVTKLEFTACSITYDASIRYHTEYQLFCSVPGITTSDRVIVTKEFGNPCFVVAQARPFSNDQAEIFLVNACPDYEYFGTQTYSVIVYRPG